MTAEPQGTAGDATDDVADDTDVVDADSDETDPAETDPAGSAAGEPTDGDERGISRWLALPLVPFVALADGLAAVLDAWFGFCERLADRVGAGLAAVGARLAGWSMRHLRAVGRPFARAAAWVRDTVVDPIAARIGGIFRGLEAAVGALLARLGRLLEAPRRLTEAALAAIRRPFAALGAAARRVTEPARRAVRRLVTAARRRGAT
ncbi:MAG: hypothetical protein S0880_27325 [Actinomycetota bacterium]|nr:hypothetical protein [Actinomycetota bacterium]